MAQQNAHQVAGLTLKELMDLTQGTRQVGAHSFEDAAHPTRLHPQQGRLYIFFVGRVRERGDDFINICSGEKVTIVSLPQQPAAHGA